MIIYIEVVIKYILNTADNHCLKCKICSQLQRSELDYIYDKNKFHSTTGNLSVHHSTNY